MKKKASHHQKDVVIAEIDAKTNNIIEKGDKEMAKKVTKKEEIATEEEIAPVEEVKEEITSVEEVKEAPVEEKKVKNKEKTGKYAIGSIVYVSKDADADLNGFKLFPQYKKYTYTVEAYDAKSGVYSLRRLNLSLSLPESLIISPDERAHDMINRKQF
jgi:hypothetical protein